ncbi:MAG: hypothetical protein EOP45_08980 [Sphingobacteriaceae bacterium]|nr:MAG: hypothetical protein EOP45_08980 [Sphingobacteriaceae bacterium]
MKFKDFPVATRPIFRTNKLNEVINIFEGNFALEMEDGKSLPCSGTLQWNWLPTPKLQFKAHFNLELSDAHQVHTAFLSPNTKVHIPGFAPIAAAPHNFQLFTTITGSLRGLLKPNDRNELKSLIFHVPNFPDYCGRAIRSEKSARTGRLFLQAAGWDVTIDNLEKTAGLLKVLNERSGYAITHAGVLKRTDGDAFLLEDAEKFMEYLSFYLSFLTGRWSPPILWVGKFTDGESDAYIIPAYLRLDNWIPAQSWCNIAGRGVQGDIEALFPSFIDRFTKYPELFRLAVSWYLEVLSNKLVSDTRIVLTQAALELLGLGLPPLLGHKVTGKAEHRIRNLFTYLTPHVPLHVPASLSNLTAILIQEPAKNWNRTKSGLPDIPSVIVSTRNLIAHPAQKETDKALLCNIMALYEISQLGIWYLEIVLLSWLEYKGHYNSRLISGGWVHEGEVFP